MVRRKSPLALCVLFLALLLWATTMACNAFSSLASTPTPTSTPTSAPTLTPTVTPKPTHTRTLTPTPAPIPGIDIPAIVKDLASVDLSKSIVDVTRGDLKFRLTDAYTKNQNLMLDIEWHWTGTGKPETWINWIVSMSAMVCKGYRYNAIGHEEHSSQAPTSGYLFASIKYPLPTSAELSHCRFELEREDDKFSIPIIPLLDFGHFRNWMG